MRAQGSSQFVKDIANTNGAASVLSNQEQGNNLKSVDLKENDENLDNASDEDPTNQRSKELGARNTLIYLVGFNAGKQHRVVTEM